MSNARINCLIEGCKRTRKNDNGLSEWICAKHWAPIPKIYKRVFRRVQRVLKERNDLGSYRRFRRIWEKCVEEAEKNAPWV